jgi:hypothetical protein
MDGKEAAMDARPFPIEARRGSGRTPSVADAALLRDAAGRRLRCRVCGAVITGEGHRVEIAGGHVHRRVNPAGFEFELGCFDAAAGAAVVGPPTAEFSWFAGYAWSYSVCRACGAHLGWYFEGGEGAFHGLILNRLELESEVPES